MGGTDAVDQRVACYRPRVKTVTWMQRIFIHFLNVAVVNCYIYCKHSKRAKLPDLHLAFRERLIEELCSDLWASRQLKEVEHVDKRQKLANWEKDQTRLAGLHLPEMVYTEEGRELESIKKSVRKVILRQGTMKGDTAYFVLEECRSSALPVVYIYAS